MEQPGNKQSRGGLDRVRKLLGGGLAWWEFSPIHTVSASSLRHQAHSLVNKLLLLRDNPRHHRKKVIERF